MLYPAVFPFYKRAGDLTAAVGIVAGPAPSAWAASRDARQASFGPLLMAPYAGICIESSGRMWWPA